MFPEPIKWTNDPGSGARPAVQPPATLDFVMAYQSALDEIAASEAWLHNPRGDEPGFSPPSALAWPTSSSQDHAIPPVALRDESPSVPSGFDKSQLAGWMDAHALARSSHRCAMYCRQGMEAAGLTTSDRPRSGDAADYGPFLLRHGAQVVAPSGYAPQVGDTVVFDRTEQHPNGHIEIYDGRQWVSDFVQHSFSPYRDAGPTPSFTIYRLS